MRSSFSKQSCALAKALIVSGAILSLTGCGVGSAPANEEIVEEEVAPPDPAKTAPEAKRADVLRDDGKLSCALAGNERFTRTCALERISNEDGKQMIFRHPDGGFRRFLVVSDGRGLVAADGADDAIITILDDKVIEIDVDGDRYQMPATVSDES